MELQDTSLTQHTHGCWAKQELGPYQNVLFHGDHQVCGVRWGFGKPPAILPDVVVGQDGGVHPDPGAGNTPAFLTSDIASVAPVNIASVC